MPRSHYTIVGKNPNPRGACLCSPTKLQDCKGPYIVFGPGVEMMDTRQPHPVLSAACACAAIRKAAKRSDAPACAKPPAPPEPAEKTPVPDEERERALDSATSDELLAALGRALVK